MPFHGIPFPGTYLVDEHGIVTAKAFHSNLAQRESPEGLIDAALGEILLRSEEPTVAAHGDDGIGFSTTYHGGGGVIRIGQLRRLVIRVDLPDGLHIYDEPVPAGMQATQLRLVGPRGLRSHPVEKPPTEPLDLPGVGELRVWSGTVDFVLPVWATSELEEVVRSDGADQVTIELEIDYQACDDQACRLPRSAKVELDVPVALSSGSSNRRAPGSTRMDTQRWMGEMISRGLGSSSDPDAAESFVADLIQRLSQKRRAVEPAADDQHPVRESSSPT